MPPPKPPITLIVATTPIRARPSTTTTTNDATAPPKLGIGQDSTLPWPRIKADMSFFARVTARAPSPESTNAVVMGRKTYESIPGNLRPLARRVNVVVSRNGDGGVTEGVLGELRARRGRLAASAAAAGSTGAGGRATDAIVAPSLQAALAALNGYARLGKIFVIGGAEIYAAALRLTASELEERPLRIVMTDVRRKEGEFECDTFFPVERFTAESGWREASAQEVEEWVGEKIESDWREEGEVLIRMVGFERQVG